MQGDFWYNTHMSLEVQEDIHIELSQAPQRDARWHRRDWEVEPTAESWENPDPSLRFAVAYESRGDIVDNKPEPKFVRRLHGLRDAIHAIPDEDFSESSLEVYIKRLARSKRFLSLMKDKDKNALSFSGAIAHDVNKAFNKVEYALKSYEMVGDSDVELTEQIRISRQNGMSRLFSAIDGWCAVIGFVNGDPLKFSSGADTMVNINEIAGGKDRTLNENAVEAMRQIRIPSGPLEIIFGNLRSNSDGVFEDRLRAGQAREPANTIRWGYFLSPDHLTLTIRLWDRAGGFPPSVMPEGEVPQLGMSERSGGTGLGNQLIDDMVAGLGAEIEVGNWSQDGEVRGACHSIIIPLHQTTEQVEST